MTCAKTNGIALIPCGAHSHTNPKRQRGDRQRTDRQRILREAMALIPCGAHSHTNPKRQRGDRQRTDRQRILREAIALSHAEPTAILTRSVSEGIANGLIANGFYARR